MKVITGAPPFLMNWMDPDQLYDVDVYVSTLGPAEFFGSPRHRKAPPVEKATPDWSLKDITYSLDSESNPSRNKTIDLDMQLLENEVLGPKNKTLWVHARLKTENPLRRQKMTHPRHQQLLDLMPALREVTPEVMAFDSSVPLIAYH